MREADVELILQRAKEKYPEAKPRIISDNGPQFIARDFKEFIRISGMTRPDLPLLSTVERQDRAVAQVAENRMHSAGNAAVAGRRTASGRGLRGALQQRPPEQCHRLHHSKGHARRPSAGDSSRAGSEVGRGKGTAEESPPAGGVMDETDCSWLADNAELTQRQGQAYSQRSESPRFPEESLHLGTRAAVDQVL